MQLFAMKIKWKLMLQTGNTKESVDIWDYRRARHLAKFVTWLGYFHVNSKKYIYINNIFSNLLDDRTLNISE